MSETDTPNRPDGGASGRQPLSLNRDTGMVKQSFSHGRSKQVVVETKRKRMVITPGAPGPGAKPPVREAPAEVKSAAEPPRRRVSVRSGGAGGSDRAAAASKSRTKTGQSGLSEEELRARQTALAQRKIEENRRRAQAESDQIAIKQREAEARRLAEEKKTRETLEEKPAPPAPAQEPSAKQRRDKTPERPRGRTALAETPQTEIALPPQPTSGRGKKSRNNENQTSESRPRPRSEPKRRKGKLTIAAALGADEGRQRSLASVRRARERERERRSAKDQDNARGKVAREVTIPESISLQDLANRMSERVSALIKFMIAQGETLHASDRLDADMAELIATEFGHRVKRVSEADVEIGLDGSEDEAADLQSRPPVVTVMGHVDHGKTSLLDAMRHSDIAAGEAGGITQHIGAWQIEIESGAKITFIDTPGHAAFSAMRARGTSATDIVVLVVAADDGVMPQTVEAINHARSAGVPIIVAVNKCDVEDADPDKVLTDLLQHDIQVEAHGGEAQAVQVSAKEKTGLKSLGEAITLQAEFLELKANPNREAGGIVIESRIDKGRGPLASVLMQRGTLSRGDIVIAGAEWGKVRALSDAHGQTISQAGPGQPVEILGLAGAPEPGQALVAVESEARAREITQYRSRLARNKALAPAPRASLEQMMASLNGGDSAMVEAACFLIKADMQGSVEAITQSIETISGDEIPVRIVHGAVGGVSESDVLLASTTGAPIIAFNVRAPGPVQQTAEARGVEIRYYSIIYDLLDDVRALLSGMLAPEQRETFIGYADILEIFDITRTGKVAGCKITEGIIKRGCGVRLLRDDVVIHQGELSTLRRFKEEVAEVKFDLECGMAFKDYQDIRVGDRIEGFIIEEIARTLD